jgi:hypothetical protein
VGDPAEAFPVPSDCPPEARVKAGGAADEKPIHEAKTLAALLPALRHTLARYRFLNLPLPPHAIETLRVLPRNTNH